MYSPEIPSLPPASPGLSLFVSLFVSPIFSGHAGRSLSFSEVFHREVPWPYIPSINHDADPYGMQRKV
jgi:hypothetical protein